MSCTGIGRVIGGAHAPGKKDNKMLVFDAEKISSIATMERLVACLQEAFSQEWEIPPRQVIGLPGDKHNRLLLTMPTFEQSGGGAVKLLTVFPDNPVSGLPTIQGVVVLFSETGTPIAVLDGLMVTRLRTAAASALASKYLSRSDSAHLVVAGTGALAPYMALAHCAVRPIQRISVWGRSTERAQATAQSIRSRVSGIEVEPADSLERAVAMADIVSCATSSATPILEGHWLRPGTFVDLVGSFSPEARESDDDVIRRARIFVDTNVGALAEAGDVLDPLRRGIITRDKIEGELSDLVCGRSTGRSGEREITLFKSVGTAIEDLAAAKMIVASQ